MKKRPRKTLPGSFRIRSVTYRPFTSTLAE